MLHNIQPILNKLALQLLSLACVTCRGTLQPALQALHSFWRNTLTSRAEPPRALPNSWHAKLKWASGITCKSRLQLWATTKGFKQVLQ